MRRVAICIGLSSFGAAPVDGPAAWSPLERAAERAGDLAAAFTRLGYDCRTHDRLDAVEIGGTVRAAIDSLGSGDVLVVHVLSHGYATDTGHLRVVGADGAHHEATDVEQWLIKVADSEGTAPTTLFLLDVCYAGTAARLGWQQTLNDEDTRAWVIAAAAPSPSRSP